MRAARRQPERSPRRHPEKAALGIEHVEEREEVALVGSAAVEEDKQPLGVTHGRARQMAQCVGGHVRRTLAEPTLSFVRLAVCDRCYARRPSTTPKSACRHVACAKARPFVRRGGTPGSPRAGW